MSGWGLEVFSGYNHWWLVPILACHLGGVLGAVIYWLFLHQQDDDDNEDNIHKIEDDDKIIRELTMSNLRKSNQNQPNHMQVSVINSYYQHKSVHFSIQICYTNVNQSHHLLMLSAKLLMRLPANRITYRGNKTVFNL